MHPHLKLIQWLERGGGGCTSSSIKIAKIGGVISTINCLLKADPLGRDPCNTSQANTRSKMFYVLDLCQATIFQEQSGRNYSFKKENVLFFEKISLENCMDCPP
jgi:hypothetical protein